MKSIVKYITSLSLLGMALFLAVALLLEAPSGVTTAQAESLASKPSVVRKSELRVLSAKDLDISKLTPVVVTGTAVGKAAASVMPLVSMPSANVTTGLNVRLAASKKSRLVGSLRRGQDVAVLTTQGNWTKVRASTGIEGWVASKYLKTQASE